MKIRCLLLTFIIGCAQADDTSELDSRPVTTIDVVYQENASFEDVEALTVTDEGAAQTLEEMTVPDEDILQVPEEEVLDDVLIGEEEATWPEPFEEVIGDLVPDAQTLCAPNSTECKCKTNDDCDHSFDTQCAINACNKTNGICMLAPSKTDGTPCDDGDVCTVDDVCSKTKCVGVAISCADNNPCTKDTCDKVLGCVHEPVAGWCEGKDACRGPDYCDNGECVEGPLIVCDDKNDCTMDSCDSVKGCIYKPVAGDCDDSDVCTTGDHCESGVCVPTGMVDCDDKNECTVDWCDRVTGCQHDPKPDNTSCDDKDPCTANDRCMGGVCKGQETGECFWCGDETCNAPSETCENCPGDCGECPSDCEISGALGCGGQLDGTTMGGTNAMESYAFPACFWLTKTIGPERVISFATKQAVRVQATVTASKTNPYLFVLEQNCNPLSCIAEGIGFLSTKATATFLPVSGKEYYLTVDGDSAVPFSFHMDIECLEAVCDDGLDNDGNGLTDCMDEECGGTTLYCNAAAKTATVAYYSHVKGYGPSCANVSGGYDDAMFRLSVDGNKTVTINVNADPSSSGDDYDIFVLSGGCTGAYCIKSARGSGTSEQIKFDAQPGTYYVVVELYSEGSDSTGRFNISATCL